MLLNVKMATNVVVLTFRRTLNFMLSRVENDIFNFEVRLIESLQGAHVVL